MPASLSLPASCALQVLHLGTRFSWITASLLSAVVPHVADLTLHIVFLSVQDFVSLDWVVLDDILSKRFPRLKTISVVPVPETIWKAGGATELRCDPMDTSVLKEIEDMLRSRLKGTTQRSVLQVTRG